MKEYIVHEPKDKPCAIEEYTSFYGEPIEELTRCKDCLHNLQIGTDMYCVHLFGIRAPISADDYCSRAERKEE